MSTSLVIPRGTTCYASQVGEYNFYYPDFDRRYKTQIPTEVTRLTWVGHAGYAAVKVAHPSNYMPLKVLWIKEVDLPV